MVNQLHEFLFMKSLKNKNLKRYPDSFRHRDGFLLKSIYMTGDREDFNQHLES